MKEPSPSATGGPSPDAPATSRALRGDSLLHAMLLTLTLTGGQRLVGFVRGILFCRWLPPEELGTWDLAFGFLLLAAPLAVLGIPGAFGRYVERYRQSGQLRSFLRKTTLVGALAAVVGVALIALAPDWFGWFIFGEPGNVHLVLLTAGCLATVIAYNFATELFTALRQMRAVSIMAMVNSVLFAAIGVGLLSLRQDAGMILIAYGVACATTALVAVAALWRITSQSPTDTASLAHGALWTRLMPFAVGVWVTNLLVNLFAVSDRYMIMHFSGLDRDAAAALVGNYHSSRVVPVLLASIAGMVGGMLLPYLSRDWEAGRRDAASDQVNLVLKAFGLLLFAAGIGVLAFSPFLFTVVLAGKYASGLDVLPWTTVYCIWFSLSLLAGSYLWCAERPRMTCLIYFLGLLGNVALNAVLVPRWGLPGAVWATAAANGLALALSLLVAYRLGLKRDAGVWLPVVVPLALPLGAPIAFVVLAAVAWIAVRTNWIFTVDQRQQFFAALAPYWRKFAPTPAAESTTPG